jgi:tRNA(Met) C34 N-acetyltransferase TmcA
VAVAAVHHDAVGEAVAAAAWAEGRGGEEDGYGFVVVDVAEEAEQGRRPVEGAIVSGERRVGNDAAPSLADDGRADEACGSSGGRRRRISTTASSASSGGGRGRAMARRGFVLGDWGKTERRRMRLCRQIIPEEPSGYGPG